MNLQSVHILDKFPVKSIPIQAMLSVESLILAWKEYQKVYLAEPAILCFDVGYKFRVREIMAFDHLPCFQARGISVSFSLWMIYWLDNGTWFFMGKEGIMLGSEHL